MISGRRLNTGLVAGNWIGHHGRAVRPVTRDTTTVEPWLTMYVSYNSTFQNRMSTPQTIEHDGIDVNAFIQS